MRTRNPAWDEAQGNASYGQAHEKGNAYYPMQVYNGSLTRKPDRLNSEADVDHSGREFRRFVNASGAQDAQIYNGLQRRTAMGFRIPWVTYLYAAGSVIPGQMRDSYGGNVNVGPGPLEFQSIFQQTAGSQPQAPGGNRQISGQYLSNPGTS